MNNTKFCSACRKRKRSCFFSKNRNTKDGFCCQCKKCRNKKAAEYRKLRGSKNIRNEWYIKVQKPTRNKIMRDLKINGCAICGYDKCGRALNFHHTNPENKQFCVCKATLLKKSKKSLKEEINKCILLCCNCHNEIHERGINKCVK